MNGPSEAAHLLRIARKDLRAARALLDPAVADVETFAFPLEAQRLGLEAHASDLNPVPVLITKALIEIPPKFAGKPPVHPLTTDYADNTDAEKKSSVKSGKRQAKLGGSSEMKRVHHDYRLYTICGRRKWAKEALACNALVLSWSDVAQMAPAEPGASPVQGELV